MMLSQSQNVAFPTSPIINLHSRVATVLWKYRCDCLVLIHL